MDDEQKEKYLTTLKTRREEYERRRQCQCQSSGDGFALVMMGL